MKENTLQTICGKLAALVPDKTTGNFYRPDYSGWLEGNGYALRKPAENAGWRLGCAERPLLPQVAMGDVFVAGSDGRKRALRDVPVRQSVRAAALDDGSGRGIHVFVSLECAGLSHAEVRRIRLSLSAFLCEQNVVTLHLISTGDAGGADTVGLWGDPVKAAVRNLPLLLSKKTAADAVSGRNADIMEFLRYSAAACVKDAVGAMAPGSLSSAKSGDALLLKWQPETGGARFASLTDGVLRFGGKPETAGADWETVPPLLNVFTEQVLVPADNAAFLLAAKLKQAEPDMVKFETGDKRFDYYYQTEAGVARLGEDLYFALVPTDAAGFGLTKAATLRPGLKVVGFVSDALGVRRQKDKLNGIWTKTPADAGKRTRTEINGALTRAVQKL